MAMEKLCGNISTILFDMDDTLLDRDQTMRHYLKGQHARFELDFDCDFFLDTILHFQKGGYGDKLQAYQQTLAQCQAPHKLAEDLYDDFILNYGDQAFLFPDIPETLQQLSKRYSLALVTNGRSRSQRGKIQSTALEPFFDLIVVSEEIGEDKPHPKIFQFCLESLKVSANECLFVGDHPTNDVQGALDMGMSAAWVRTNKHSPPTNCDFYLNHVSELLERL